MKALTLWASTVSTSKISSWGLGTRVFFAMLLTLLTVLTLLTLLMLFKGA